MSEPGDAQALRSDVEAMDALQDGLHFHHLPIAGLGGGRTTLEDKFHAVLFSIFLESGSSTLAFRRYCKSIVVGTYDLGTEFSLSLVQDIDVAKLFPWSYNEAAAEREVRAGELDDAFDFCDEEDEEADAEVEVGLSGSLAAPGMLHCIHNCAAEVLSAAPVLSTAVDSLAYVSKLLTEPGSCERLLETCFHSAAGVLLRPGLLKFHARVYRGRWGTVAFACDAIMRIQRQLTWGWSLRKYKAAGATLDRKAPITVEIETVDTAIQSQHWWASMMTLNMCYEMVRDMFSWSEGCACHSHLDRDDASRETQLRWQSCPLRGMRLPEVSSGDFFLVLNKLADESVAKLLVALPTGLKKSEIVELIMAFEKVRAAMLYTMTLKMSCYCTPPRLIFAAAHHSAVVSRDAVRRCLDLCDHPRLEALKAGDLRDEAFAYIDGVELELLPRLSHFIAELRFGFGCERRVEGGHAFIMRRAALARNRSEAWDSLALRMKEIQDILDKKPDFMEQLASYIAMSRSPRKLVKALKLDRHPALQAAADSWDKIYRRVVYHADQYTLYRSGRPVLHIGPRPPPPGLPPLPPPKLPLPSMPSAGPGSSGAPALAAPSAEPPDAPAPSASASASAGPPDVLALAAPSGPTGPPDAPALAPADCNLDGVYTRLKRRAALSFLVGKFNVMPDSESSLWCASFPMCSVSPLMRKLGASTRGLSAGLFATDQPCDRVWFSIVDPRVSKSKRAFKDELASSDVSITMHRVMGHVAGKPIVATTPANLVRTHILWNVQEAALVLSTASMSVSELESISHAEVEPELFYLFDGEDADQDSSQALQKLVDKGDDGDGIRDDDLVDVSAKLVVWESNGLLARSRQPAGYTEWRFTDAGQLKLRVGYVCSLQHRMLEVRDVPVTEMTKFELLRSMELAGFVLFIVTSKKEMKKIKADPYVHGESPKRWYARPTLSLANLCVPYLKVLLLAGDHLKPVKHVGKVGDYRAILDPGYAAKAIQRRLARPKFSRENDWGALLDTPAGAGKPCKRRRKALADEPPAEALLDDEPPAEALPPASRSSSSSSSRSSSLSDASESAELRSDTDEDDKVKGVHDAPGSGSDCSDKPEKGKAKSSVEESEIELPSFRVGPVGFGLCKIVQRMRQGALVGYQVTCTHPRHRCKEGCQKENSFSTAGSEDVCLRQLLAWIVFGCDAPDRKGHKFDAWKTVLQLGVDEGDGLPSLKTLWKMRPLDWKDYDQAAALGPVDRPLLEEVEGIGAAFLGDAAPGCPPEVHYRMQEMARKGALPSTSPGQRARQKLVPGTTYGVPPMYREALRFGYLNPNLTCPDCYVWRCQANTWLLSMKGG